MNLGESSKERTEELKGLAQELIDKDINVIPVTDKKLLKSSWQTTVGEDVFTTSFNSFWRKANGLGVICGESSGIICLDIDVRETAEQYKLDFQKELDAMLPPIYCGMIGNPIKKSPARLYRYNGEAAEKFPYVDCELIAKGNQKVIPPSYNDSGDCLYQWVGKSLFEIDDVDDLPILDPFVLEFIRSKNEEYKTEKEYGHQTIELTKVPNRSKSGSHLHMGRVGMRLFNQGALFEDIVDAVIEEDRKVNADSDFLYFLCPERKTYGPNARVNAKQFVGEFFYRNSNKRHKDSEFFKEELADGFTIHIEEKNKTRMVRQHISLYNYLKIKSDPWYLPEAKMFYLWDGKKYSPFYDDYIKAYAQKMFKNPACINIGDKATFLDYVKNSQQAEAKDFSLDANGLVNFNNGIYNLKSGQLGRHEKEHKMPYVIASNLGSNKPTPNWDALIDLISLKREHIGKAILEYLGYILSACNYQQFNKMLILDGGGSNGKSTLMRVIQDIIGEDNCSAIGLSSITNDRFAGFDLVGKLLNTCAEEDTEAFAATGPVKKITGGDAIRVEQKNKGAFSYTNFAKLIISYNKVPFFPDDSIGMKRRVMLIPFEQDLETYPERKLPDIEERIRPEHDDIAFKAIKAFEGVITRGQFTIVPEGVLKLEGMITESSALLSFIQDEITITGDSNDYITKSNLWSLFEDYMGVKHKYTKRKFLKEFESIAHKISMTVISKKTVSGHIFTGVLADSLPKIT